ncbi:MAG: hypothetical protein HKN19_06445 [Halioglobus sp.]|nr:hypothetical protein [Halioglobus sp.]
MELDDLSATTSPLPWQSQQWSRLLRQLEDGQLPHAMLFTGAQYSGKAQFALALARLLLCAEPRDGLGCGNCHACVLSRGGSHGDFLWLAPEPPSRAIKIDQVRSALQFTARTAGFGLRKVVVFNPADALNLNAFNALLKCLEEPSENTHLMLVCHRPHALPATIRSRCQRCELPLPGEQEASDWLGQVAGEETRRSLLLADNKPMLAKALFETGELDDVETRLLALRGLLEGKLDPPAAQAAWDGGELTPFLDNLAGQLFAFLRQQGAATLRTPRARGLFALLDELASLRAAVEAGANPNPQMTISAILAKMHTLLGGSSAGDNMRERTGRRSQ